jgi:hypothetical protein
MDTDEIVYTPDFLKTDSAIQKLIGRKHENTDTKTAWSSHKPTLISSEMRKVG